jgi:seryl-tRNA synthetase
MLDVKILRQNTEEIKKAMESRNEDPRQIDKIIALDEKRREFIQKADELKAKRNQLSKAVAKLKSAGKKEEAAKRNRRKTRSINLTIAKYSIRKCSGW